MNIQFEDLFLERVTVKHTRDIFSLFGNSTLTKYFASGPDKAIEDSAVRVNKMSGHWNKYSFGDFIVKDIKSSEIIGFGGLHYKISGGKVNVSYIVHEKFWRRGTGSKICKCLLDYGFNTLKLKEIVAEIDPLNINSIKLVKKHNFKFNRDISWNGVERVEYLITLEKYNRQ